MIRIGPPILLCTALVGSCLCYDVLSLFTTQPLEVGTAAPELTLPSVDGEMISLSDFSGQVVLLNFWSDT